MERSRRGKLYAARKGEVKVLAAAPYGYKYVSKQLTGSQAIYELIEEEAVVIRQLFKWAGLERLSLNEITRRLATLGMPTRKGKKNWDRGTLLHILKNPAYKGTAAFGKTKIVARLPHLRQHRNRTVGSKRVSSIQSTPKNEWIYIPVPLIVDEDLFDTVQEQLEENRKHKRERKGSIKFLLSGLMVCEKCGYSYSGNGTSSLKYKYGYYICVGGKNYCYRTRICDNKSIRSDFLENLVWEEIKKLLNDPASLEKEYQRRLDELAKKPDKVERNKLIMEKKKIQGSISRLIDSYAAGFIDKQEFEPRITVMKLRISTIEQQVKKFADDDLLQIELQSFITCTQVFSNKIEGRLNDADWQTKRTIMKALIKRVEVGEHNVNVVFRVTPYGESDYKQNFLGDCCKSNRFRKTR